MLTDHELMAETKGPPAKRQRGDSPLETPNADPAGKCTSAKAYISHQILFFSFYYFYCVLIFSHTSLWMGCQKNVFLLAYRTFLQPKLLKSVTVKSNLKFSSLDWW